MDNVNRKGTSASAPNMLEVGVSVHNGLPDNTEWNNAATVAVQSALRQRTDPELPARAIVLFATPEWCQPDRPLSALVRSAARSMLGYDVPLIGGSMPRIFASVPGPNGPTIHCVEQGFVLIMLYSNDMWVVVDSVQEPYKLADNERWRQLGEMAARLRHPKQMHLGLGTSASADLFAVLPGPYLDESSTRCFHDIELHEDITKAFGDVYALFGGSASNDLERPTKGFQFADDLCLSSSLVVALMEHDFRTGGAMSHGFKLVPNCMISVDEIASKDSTSDYVVSKLDDQPAADRLRVLMEQVNYPGRRPILGLGASDDCHIVVPLEARESWTGAVRFNRRLSPGYRLSVLTAKSDDLRKRAQEIVKVAVKKTGATASDLRLVLAMASQERFVRFNDEEPGSWWESAKELSGEYLDHIPLVCGIVAGEYAEDNRRRPRGDNLSVWIVCMAGTPNVRARNRLLNVELLSAAREVLEQHSPADVMRTAVETAIQVGADGGQISMCDLEHRLILGGDHGYADSNPASGQDLSIALKMTNRTLPAEGVNFRLQEDLRKWCLPVGPLPPSSREEDLPADTDILAIAAVNRVCTYVPDSRDPLFHCDQKAIEAGNIQAQFIMPLLGSNYDVLGTLQVGFPLNHYMDRETLGLWMGFGQKVAAALERAFEAEERELTQRISELGNQIMQRPVNADGSVARDIEDFLQGVQEELRVDYIHMRIRLPCVQEPRRYQLIVSPSRLGVEHASLRPAILEHEGSMGHALVRGRIFTLTERETAALYPPATDPRRDHQKNWDKALESYRTVANVLLGTPSDPLGCLVMHSRSEYFFTTRRRRLILQAASKLESLVVSRETAYVEQRRKTLEQHMVHQGFWAAKTIHDLMRELTNIKGWAELLLRSEVYGRAKVEEIYRATERMIALLKERARGMEMGSRIVSVFVLLAEAQKGMSYANSPSFTPRFVPPSEEQKVNSNIWLRAALAGLMDNAAESAAAHDGQISVTVTYHPNIPRALWISIENDGPKLTDQEIAQMRTAGHSTKQGHLGLGIPLAEAGIFSADGQLVLRPRSGGGLQAIVQLPEQHEAQILKGVKQTRLGG